MTPEASTFAAHFREVVIPRLEPFLRVHGHLVGTGTMDFEEAASVCMSVAIRAGVSRLDPRVFDDFNDWLLTRIAEAAEAVPPRIRRDHETRKRAAADIVAWDRKVRAHFAEGNTDGA